MFKESIIFKSEGEEDGNIAWKLLKGAIRGEFSFAALKALVGAVIKGAKLEQHYRKYPEAPAGYPVWEKKAQKLWAAAGSMADTVTDA